jgi:hypothetical protein
MSSTAKRVGFAIIGAASLAGLALFANTARADKQLTCEMTGHWIEQREPWVFQARYTAKDGPDFFTGLYFNATAGTTANVKGVVEKGTWLIRFEYTDQAHKGQVRELVGNGKLVGYNLLDVRGTYAYKDGARNLGTGAFDLIGKCK